MLIPHQKTHALPPCSSSKSSLHLHQRTKTGSLLSTNINVSQHSLPPIPWNPAPRNTLGRKWEQQHFKSCQHTHTHTCMHMHAHTCTTYQTYEGTHSHSPVYTYSYTYTHMHIHTYKQTGTHTNTYMNIHTQNNQFLVAVLAGNCIILFLSNLMFYWLCGFHIMHLYPTHLLVPSHSLSTLAMYPPPWIKKK